MSKQYYNIHVKRTVVIEADHYMNIMANCIVEAQKIAIKNDDNSDEGCGTEALIIENFNAGNLVESVTAEGWGKNAKT